MKSHWPGICGALIVLCGLGAAPRARAADLQLIPQPREVKETGGAAFAVTRHTRIVVDQKFGQEFQGAQMLSEEIERWTGWKLKISGAREMPGGSNIIYIGNATEDSRLREALGTSGLAMKNGFDAQGYAISADAHRILVGGASEQGAFYGVQTLRQLLRPANASSGTRTAESLAIFKATGQPSAAEAAADCMQLAARLKPCPDENRGAEVGLGIAGDSAALERVNLVAAKPYGAEAERPENLITKTGQKSGEESDPEKDVLECPAVAIRDWPAMKWRGVSVDISRGPIPTLAFMENQIRVLAGYKLNMYALYMEDVFTVAGNQLFAPPDALSPEEIKKLVAYAQEYYVTIVPELETYGHLHNILRYDLYSDLAEIPHGSVLTPTQPGTYDLLGKMIAEMAPLFPGPFFHIGADETFELGEGKTKQLIAEKGLGPVYLAHITKLDEMLKPFHKQTMFWADIAEKFPQLLPTLPKDLIAVVWTYDNAPSYDNRLKPFQDVGLPLFVSPGITSWRRVYPDFNYSFMNIRNLTRDGQKYGALGMLNTDWKDMGEELGGMDWPGLVFGAACAWQAGESSVEQFRDSYDWAFYRNTDHTFEDILDRLAATNTLLDGVKLEGTHVAYFWADPFSTVGSEYAETAAPVTQEMRVDAERAWEALLENRAKARLNADTLDDLIFAAQRLDTMGMKFEYTQEMSEAYWDAYMDMNRTSHVLGDLERISSVNGDLQDLREKLNELRGEYAERWRAENSEAWLSNVLVRYDALENTVQEKINTIDALEESFPRVRELPPPESLGFYWRPAPAPTQGPLNHRTQAQIPRR
ncbi:MAG: glycoside hydrolase family 20 zincin-like fold domain-containing protein [Candidatus Acidiferrales bacterium]